MPSYVQKMEKDLVDKLTELYGTAPLQVIESQGINIIDEISRLITVLWIDKWDVKSDYHKLRSILAECRENEQAMKKK